MKTSEPKGHGLGGVEHLYSLEVTDLQEEPLVYPERPNLSERFGVDVPCQIWFAHQTRTATDATRDMAFGGSWEGMKAFAPAEYLYDISDFTTDRMGSCWSKLTLVVTIADRASIAVPYSYGATMSRIGTIAN